MAIYGHLWPCVSFTAKVFPFQGSGTCSQTCHEMWLWLMWLWLQPSLEPIDWRHKQQWKLWKLCSVLILYWFCSDSVLTVLTVLILANSGKSIRWSLHFAWMFASRLQLAIFGPDALLDRLSRHFKWHVLHGPSWIIMAGLTGKILHQLFTFLLSILRVWNWD